MLSDVRVVVSRRGRRAFWLALLLVACSGGDTEVEPDFVLGFSPVDLIVRQGESAQGVVTLTRDAGHAEAVSVVPEALPPHVTISPIEFSTFETQLFFTISADVGALLSGTWVTMRATASDGSVRTGRLFISVRSAPPPSFTVQVARESLTLLPRNTTLLPLRITRLGGFTDSVVVRAEELPEGVSMAPVVVRAGRSADTARFVADRSTLPGRRFVQLIASGGSQPEDTTTVVITVPFLPSAIVVFNPHALQLSAGDSATSTLLVQLVTNGPTGRVRFTPLAAPPGFDVRLRVLPDSSRADVLVRAGPDVAPGSYSVAIELNDFAPLPDTALLPVEVSAPGNMLFLPCEATGIPVAVAFQDGNGPWQAARGFPGNRYYPNIISGRGGIAWATPEGSGTHVRVVYGTLEELVRYHGSVCVGAPSGRASYTGRILDVRPGDAVQLFQGTPFTRVVQSGGTFRIDEPPEGLAGGLFAVRRQTPSGIPRVFALREVDPNSGLVLPPVDFSSPLAYDAVSSRLTIPNATNRGVIIETAFRQSSAVDYFVPHRVDSISAGVMAYTWYGSPLGRMVAGDKYLVTIREPQDPPLAWSRSASRAYDVPPSSSTLSLPAVPAPPVLSSVRSPQGHVVIRAGLVESPSAIAFVDANYTLELRQATGQRLTLTTTRGYLAGVPLAIDVPAFTTPNWLAAWRLQPGAATNWRLQTRRWEAGFFFAPSAFGVSESTEYRGASSFP